MNKREESGAQLPKFIVSLGLASFSSSEGRHQTDHCLVFLVFFVLFVLLVVASFFRPAADLTPAGNRSRVSRLDSLFSFDADAERRLIASRPARPE